MALAGFLGRKEKPVVNTIELLVHPFHTFWHIGRKGLEDKGYPFEMTKSAEAFLKLWSGIWGRHIQQVKKSPSSILVMTKMDFADPMLKRHFKKFKKFAKRELGDRLIMVSQGINKSWSAWDLRKITRNRKFRLAKEATINGRGEYSKVCIRLASKALSMELQAIGFKPRIKIIEKESVPGRLDAFARINAMKGHEKRKEQQKKKRVKLTEKRRRK